MIKIEGKIISVIIIFLMIIGSFGAVGTQLSIKTGNYENELFISGEVIIGFNSKIDVKTIDNFKGHDIIQKIENLNIAVVETIAGGEFSLINDIIDSPEIRYAEPNYIVYSYHIPNDPDWEKQYGPQRIYCPEAWDIHQGSNSVKIAIVDTGIDYNHEDLDNYVSGGYDHVNGDNDPYDDNSHGTHCAGIAAAEMDNNIGIAGVAQVSVMAEKVLGGGGSGSSSNVAAGINHAVNQGADVISMSLGSSSPSQVIKDACDAAYASGVLLVAASGNDYSSEVGYPAAFDSVIAVGATDTEDERCGFSNYGDELELMAPGYRIYSTIPNDKYERYTGTSMATPHVAGVAALAMSRYPSKDNEWIRQKLRDTAKDLNTPGWDEKTGYGLVDARLGGGEPNAIVEVTIHKVTALDDIDPWPNTEAEWYYTVNIDSQSITEYDGYEEQFFFWWIFHWNSRDTWTPDKSYTFNAYNSEVIMKVKLMDDDVLLNDVADLSERTGDPGRIFEITYDLEDDSISGDRYEDDGTWLYTRGDWDGVPGDDDDAQLWFDISDNYNYDDYKPKLDVSPTSINFGNVGEGEVVIRTFDIKNTAKEDDPFNPPQDLNWNIANSPTWMSVSPKTGSLEPGEEETVTIEIDTYGMEHRTWSGIIEVISNGGNKDVSITIRVPKYKGQFNFLNILKDLLKLNFPLIYRCLETVI